MTNEKRSIVFFGSGPVAAESLRQLKDVFLIEAVVTKPTTKTEMAKACPGVPLLLSSNKSELDVVFATNKFESSVGILIDFGIIVSTKIIDAFEKGIVNSHFSLLPQLRGADPISFAILENKTTTGVSLMLLVEAMDEGPILSQSEFVLEGNETTHTLTSSLIDLSVNDLKKTLPGWIDGEATTTQQTGVPSYTRKLTKQDGTIDWNKSAANIEREIRAYCGWPKSSTTFGNIDCIVTEASVDTSAGVPGDLFVLSKKLAVHCGSDSLVIESIKPAGKNDMSSTAFLAGYGDRIGL